MDWKDGLTVERRAVILIKKMALDADGFMRIGTRESSILAEARPRDRIRWRRLKSRKEIPCRRGEPYVFYAPGVTVGLMSDPRGIPINPRAIQPIANATAVADANHAKNHPAAVR